MKHFLSIILLSLSLTFGLDAASFSIDVGQLGHNIKYGFTQQNKWHRIVYGMETLAAVTSIADGVSTDIVNAHSRLWEPGCGCWVQVTHETNPLFITKGTYNLSQVKLWAWKAVFAAAPVATSYTLHRLLPDNTAVDATIIGLLGVSDYYYTKATINNFKYAHEIILENRASGH